MKGVHAVQDSWQKSSLSELAGQCPTCQQYFRLSKVAHMLDLSEKTLRRMIANRQLKAKRIGGSIRIPHEELSKIIKEY